MTIQVYFAGPLFTHAELAWNKMLAEAITIVNPEIRLFLPQDETSPVFEAANKNNTPPDFNEVKQICLEGIVNSSVVVAVLDGADADSGTSFECGYAFAKNIPVIGIRTDVRSGEDLGINAMLTRSAKL